MIERRWPWKTSLTRLCIWPPASSRKRVAALVIETSSSPTLKIATPFTPTGIFCLSTPVTSSSAASARSDRYCAFWSTGITNAPPPVMIRNVLLAAAPCGVGWPSGPISISARRAGAPLTPKPVMIRASSARGTRQSVLKRIAITIGTPITRARNASRPPRIGIRTSPTRPARIAP